MSLESHDYDEEIEYDENISTVEPELSRDIIDRHFGKNGISRDAINAWAYMSLRVEMPNGLMKINPVPHYEEFFQKMYPVCSEYIIGRTSKESMDEFNRLADTFNKDLARIQKENDIQTVRDYLKKITELLS